MPSASNKQEPKSPPEVTEAIKQVITAVEKKIRNLEKRKTKLDNYRKDESSGKPLDAEQKQAVARYEEVASQLELAKDFIKQFQVIGVDLAKAQRKQAKKELMERTQHELYKMKQMLLIQDVLNNMGGESVREDFLEGKNGATKLEEESLNKLDELYKLLSPSREDSGDKFEDDVAAASEHFNALIEGKSKPVLGTTYKDLKAVLDSINHCCYFGGTPAVEETTPEEQQEEFQDARETLESRSSNGPTEEEATDGKNTPQEREPEELEAADPLLMNPAQLAASAAEEEAPQSNDEAGICFLQDSQIQPPQEVMPPVETHPMMPPGLGSPRVPTPVPGIPEASPSAIPTQTFTNQSFPADPYSHSELENLTMPSSTDMEPEPAQTFSQATQPPSEEILQQPTHEPEEELKDDQDMGNWQEVPSATYTNSNSGNYRSNYKGRGGPRGGRGIVNGYGAKPQRQPYQNGRGGYSNFQSREGGGGGGSYRGDYRRDGGGPRGRGRGGPRGGGRGGGGPRGRGGYQQQQQARQ